MIIIIIIIIIIIKIIIRDFTKKYNFPRLGTRNAV